MKNLHGNTDNFIKDKIVMFDWNGLIDAPDTAPSFNYLDLRKFATCIAGGLPIDKGDIILETYDRCFKSAGDPNTYSRDEYKNWLQHLASELRVRDIYKFADAIYKIFEMYYKRVTFDAEMIKVEQIVSNQCSIGLISDIPHTGFERLRFQTKDINYSVAYISCIERRSKERGDLFEHAAKGLNYEPKNILYVDDRQYLLDKAAEKHGWSTLLHTYGNTKATLQAITDFLSPV